MKRYYVNDTTVVVGTDREIRSLYTALANHGFLAVFTGTPKFRAGSMYGIIIRDCDQFVVVNSDTLIRILVSV